MMARTISRICRILLLAFAAEVAARPSGRPMPRHMNLALRSAVRRFMHGSAGGALPTQKGLWGKYLMANALYPLRTAVATGGVLWAVGDGISQAMERHGNSKPVDRARLFGTAVEGSVFGGGIGCLWYQRLDHIVTHQLKLTPGTTRFVLAKLGLESLLWKPVVLLSFWIMVGVFEGHSPSKIKRELRNDFLPSLLSEYCLFAPLDFFNFFKVPVQYQVIVSNAGSLLEAVGLSYIHAHGFPGMSKDHGGLVKEESSMRARLPQLPLVDAVINRLSIPLSMQRARTEFADMDPKGQGYITSKQIKDRMISQMMPGMSDPVSSAKAAEILVRKADINGDGRVSLQEYLRLVEAFKRTNYREEFMGDIVHALFDRDGDGYIDRSELGRCVVVLLGPDRAAAEADKIMSAADDNGDGRLSRDEMRRALRSISATRAARGTVN